MRQRPTYQLLARRAARMHLALAAASLAAAAASAAYAQCQPALTDELHAVDGGFDDEFGFSLAVSGETLAIGAWRDDQGAANAGSVYVFDRVNGQWTQTTTLFPAAPDPAPHDLYGVSVAIAGDTLMVGAYRDDESAYDAGAVYVYHRVRGEWAYITKLMAPDGQAGDWFGVSVALSGDQALIGAFLDDDLGADSGSAYVFERVEGEWTQVQKLTASDGAAGDSFGFALAVSGDTAVIGAYLDNNPGNDSGSAYVFQRTNDVWTEASRLTPIGGAAGDRFGFSVAIDASESTIAVGAIRDSDAAFWGGAAYVFERNGAAWTQQTELTVAEADEVDFFGRALALAGSRLLVGAYNDEDPPDDPNCEAGAVYAFENDGGVWNRTAKLTAPDRQCGAVLGTAVALLGDTAFLGAPGDNDLGSSAGSVHVADLNPNDPTITQQPADVTVAVFQPAVFGVAASGAAPLSYQWRRNGVDLTDGGRVSGAQSPTLTITQVEPGDAGDYDVLISNACGFATSDTATLTVVPACPGDLNGDGTVSLPDLAILLANYGTSGGATPGQGDLDSDGDVDLGDLAELLGHYGQACP